MTDKKHSSICSCDRSARSEDLTQLKLWSISMVPSRPQTRRNNEYSWTGLTSMGKGLNCSGLISLTPPAFCLWGHLLFHQTSSDVIHIQSLPQR